MSFVKSLWYDLEGTAFPSLFQRPPVTLLRTEVRLPVERWSLFPWLEHGVKWRAFVFFCKVSDLHWMWSWRWKLIWARWCTLTLYWSTIGDLILWACVLNHLWTVRCVHVYLALLQALPLPFMYFVKWHYSSITFSHTVRKISARSAVYVCVCVCGTSMCFIPVTRECLIAVPAV